MSANIDQRILAFVNTNEQIMVTNTTENGRWSEPIVISGDDHVLTSSPALEMCAEQKTHQVMRLYYGMTCAQHGPQELTAPASQDNRIQELAFDFASQTWTKIYTLQKANPESGVACTIQHGFNHLYYRNGQTIAQWRQNLTDPDAKWQRCRSGHLL